jgi:hypothetical protein
MPRAMTARQGKWRVTVENSSVIQMDEFNSFDAALELACEKRKIKHYNVTVEGPHGVMDEEELARYCALANQK